MKAEEKVRWLQFLLILWGSVLLAPLILMAMGSPAGENTATQVARILLSLGAAMTTIYLLILSWRVAYLSGRRNKVGG